jgi:hypothetical protein
VPPPSNGAAAAPPNDAAAAAPADSAAPNGAIVPSNGRLVPMSGNGNIPKPYANGNSAYPMPYETPRANEAQAKRPLFGGLFGKKRQEEEPVANPDEPSVADRIARDFGILGDNKP